MYCSHYFPRSSKDAPKMEVRNEKEEEEEEKSIKPPPIPRKKKKISP